MEVFTSLNFDENILFKVSTSQNKTRNQYKLRNSPLIAPLGKFDGRLEGFLHPIFTLCACSRRQIQTPQIATDLFLRVLISMGYY
jgi:hypothetical protein